MKLYIARHGETDWNVDPARCQGWTDVTLNEKGLSQARKIAKNARTKKIDVIYSSHLQRAYQTAQIIADQLNVNVIIDQRLAEAKKGLWEGKPFSEIEDMYPKIWGKWQSDALNTPIPEGETISEVLERASTAINEIIHENIGEINVLIISHGGPISGIRCISSGIDFSNFHSMHPSNGEIFTLAIEPFIMQNV